MTNKELDDLHVFFLSIREDRHTLSQKGIKQTLTALTELSTLRDRVAELEAAAKPRPMSEAPRDGTEVEIVYERPESDCARYHVGKRRWLTASGYMLGPFVAGWLPIPDESKEGGA